jgi:DNA-binding transcriptional ArsR family regulator
VGVWRVNADALAGSRFVISPLSETLASLVLLLRNDASHPGERAWLEAHAAAYRARLRADPVTALLVGAALRRNWIADFFSPPPSGDGEVSFADELRRVRETPPRAARADLEVALGGPLPAPLCRDDLPELSADLLTWVWEETVRPYWRRRRRILEADVLARTRQQGQDGWAAAVNDLRPGMRWLGDGDLRINVRARPPREISGARLMFVPVTAGRGWVAWDEPDRYAVVYPCAGALTEAERPSPPEALSHLLGPARANVLVLLASPMSTSQLVALTDQGLGSVGRHLKVLREANLITRRRTGRWVVYERTPAGDTLVRAQTPGRS